MHTFAAMNEVVDAVPSSLPVLIAGPTASGKSALALEIAARQGGVIVNADASQVYSCWRIITARPSPEDEAAAPHKLYGHVDASQKYSTGHWLREVQALIGTGQRLIIVGGTGLYFSALTNGLAEVPQTPPEVRKAGDQMALEGMIDQLDEATAAKIDLQNRARVQRAWEVLTATGKGLSAWQGITSPPALPLSNCFPICMQVEKDWLNARIAKRFDMMIAEGAMDEIAAQRAVYDPSLPAHRAIGVPELIDYHDGLTSMEAAKEQAVIATRQFAKRQRTWMRSKMGDWHQFLLP